MPTGSFVFIKVLSDLKVVSWCFQCANVIVTARLSDLDLRSRILLQYERALLEVTLAGDWSVFRPSVWQAVDQVGSIAHICDHCDHLSLCDQCLKQLTRWE